MLKKIEALRKEPVEVRNRYAFWIAAGLTIVIVVIWVSTLPARFSQKEPVVVEESAPSLTIIDTVKEYIATISGRFGPVIVTQEETSPTEERIDLVEFIKNSTTTPEYRGVQPSQFASTSTTTAGGVGITSTTTSTTSHSN